MSMTEVHVTDTVQSVQRDRLRDCVCVLCVSVCVCVSLTELSPAGSCLKDFSVRAVPL